MNTSELKEIDTKIAEKIPPGQALTEDFIIYTYGETPVFNEETWNFRVFGLVEEPFRLSYKEFMALPKVTIVADFHCVTGWSLLDKKWEGVSFKEIMKLIKPKPEAKFVMVHCDDKYTTNLPIEVLMDDDVLFAYRLDDQDLPVDLGFPLRLVVPKRYAWKSAKWASGLEFMEHDKRGYWESRGYHNDGNPWKEERYS